MEKYRIGVVGCAGRMGRLNLANIAGDDRCELSGGTEAPGNPVIGEDLGTLAGCGPLGLTVGDDTSALFESSDAVIDFTLPQASLRHAALAAEKGVALVVGTTGLDAEQRAAIEAAGARTVIVQAANMSLGVNLLQMLVERVAAALDEGYDIEVLEMHHRHKIDAPSGTALALGEAAAAGRRVALDAVAQRTRDGITGARRAGDIGFATLRGGDVAGEHSVIFAGIGERIELTHKATNREVFARGALTAALWTRGRAPGFYGMREVLGL